MDINKNNFLSDNYATFICGNYGLPEHRAKIIDLNGVSYYQGHLKGPLNLKRGVFIVVHKDNRLNVNPNFTLLGKLSQKVKNHYIGFCSYADFRPKSMIPSGGHLNKGYKLAKSPK